MCGKAINLFKVHDSAGPVAVVVDLPGYGYAKLPKALQTDIGVQVRTCPPPSQSLCHRQEEKDKDTFRYAWHMRPDYPSLPSPWCRCAST